MPYHRLYFSAIAMRSAELPQVTAYWLMLPWIAAHAASFIGSGIGKSGNPCARLTASCWLAMRVISRMTDSVNVEVRRAASIRAWLPARIVWPNRRAKYRRRSGHRKAMGGPHRGPPMSSKRYGSLRRLVRRHHQVSVRRPLEHHERPSALRIARIRVELLRVGH